MNDSVNENPTTSITDAINMECPFTWEIDENLALNQELNVEIFDLRFTEQPVIAFMNNITLAYVSAVKEDYEDAVASLESAYDIFKRIDFGQPVHRDVSKDVLEHIYEATVYHLNKNLLLHKAYLEPSSMSQELVPLPKPIVNDKQPSELCTIKACQSMTWYNFKGDDEISYWLPLSLAQAASNECPGAPLYNFLVGRSLLHPLCYRSLNNWPFTTELRHLYRSYQLTGSPFFGIYIEQILREVGEHETAKLIRLNIYDSKPCSVWVKLKLAIAFVHCGDYVRAQEIMQLVSHLEPSHRLFRVCKEKFLKASASVTCRSDGDMNILEEDFDSMKL